MSADARTPQPFAGPAQLALLCARVRERRAALIPPGSEWELAWHAIVPPERRPEAPHFSAANPPTLQPENLS